MKVWQCSTSLKHDSLCFLARKNSNGNLIRWRGNCKHFTISYGEIYLFGMGLVQNQVDYEIWSIACHLGSFIQSNFLGLLSSQALL